MSTEILSLIPEFGLREKIKFTTLIFEGDIPGKERRHNKSESGIRSLLLQLKTQTEAVMDTIWDFYVARKGAYDTFWIKFPTSKNSKRLAESVGTGDGAETVFTLDCFPIDTSTLKVYLDGVLQTSGYTVTNNLTTEAAEVTFTNPVGDNVVVTADYEYYIQVRFAIDELDRELFAYLLYNTSLELIEVLWDIYTPPN
jgi:uncharacterized protein (TIGR02217 family)